MKEFIEYIAKSLVTKPEEVCVTEKQGERGTILELTVAPEDMGKIIGKQGRIARSIRTVLKAYAIKEDVHVTLDII